MHKNLYDSDAYIREASLDNSFEKKISFLYLGGKKLEDTERLRIPVVLPQDRNSFVLSQCVAKCS